MFAESNFKWESELQYAVLKNIDWLWIYLKEIPIFSANPSYFDGIKLNQYFTIANTNMKVDFAGKDGEFLIEIQLNEADHRHLGQIITYGIWQKAKFVIWIAEKWPFEQIKAIEKLNDVKDRGLEFQIIPVQFFYQKSHLNFKDPIPISVNQKPLSNINNLFFQDLVQEYNRTVLITPSYPNSGKVKVIFLSALGINLNWDFKKDGLYIDLGFFKPKFGSILWNWFQTNADFKNQIMSIPESIFKPGKESAKIPFISIAHLICSTKVKTGFNDETIQFVNREQYNGIIQWGVEKMSLIIPIVRHFIKKIPMELFENNSIKNLDSENGDFDDDLNVEIEEK